MTSFAYAYRNEDYVSIYVTLPKQDQLIFYWNIFGNEQRRQPKDRLTKTPIDTARITAFNNFGCVVEIAGRRAEFTWTDFDNPNNNPAHKGKLVNFADWEYDEDFKHDSPTSIGPKITEYTGHYAEPQPYEEEE